MIDIRNGELADLWPDETSPEFKSISYALHMAIIRMLDILRSAAGTPEDAPTGSAYQNYGSH